MGDQVIPTNDALRESEVELGDRLRAGMHAGNMSSWRNRHHGAQLIDAAVELRVQTL